MTNGYTLTFKGKITPDDGAMLRPDILGNLDRCTLEKFTIPCGKSLQTIQALFNITGQIGDHLTLRELPKLHRLGAQMASGQLTIYGNAGNQLGASMKGGLIKLQGNADDAVGGPDIGITNNRGMSGGEILITGHARHYTGFRMRRGLIAVAGRCGKSPGYRMLAGSIVIGQGPLDFPGLEMRRGSLICLEPQAHAWPNYFSVEGQFPLPTQPVLGMILTRLKNLNFPISDALMHSNFQLGSGDALELNRGELWQMASLA